MFQAMIDAGWTDKQLARFQDCGSMCSLWRSKSTGDPFIMGNFCKCRTCAPCQAARAALVRGNVAQHIAGRTVRFITLTLKHREWPLRKMIARLKVCFKALRKEEEWKQHVRGFAAFLECKHEPRSNSWHVHYHILAEGSLWMQRDISNLWLQVTGDSMIVDIRAVNDAAGGAYYAAKYATKPYDAGAFKDPMVLAEAVRELARCRLWIIGGTWKGKLRPLATSPLPDDLEFIGTLNTLFDDAERGDESAQALIQELNLSLPTSVRPP